MQKQTSPCVTVCSVAEYQAGKEKHEPGGEHGVRLYPERELGEREGKGRGERPEKECEGGCYRSE